MTRPVHNKRRSVRPSTRSTGLKRRRSLRSGNVDHTGMHRPMLRSFKRSQHA